MRSQPWLWATLAGAGLVLLAMFGPMEVLLPFRIRNELHGGSGTYATVLAASGVGAMLTSFALAQRGMPRRPVLFLFAAWALGDLAVATLGVGERTWQLAGAGLVEGAMISSGIVVWETLVRTRVPAPLLGRVTSLDWIVSLGLTPLSFALVAPLASAFGAGTTLVLTGLFGAATFLVFLPFALRPVGARAMARAGCPARHGEELAG